MTKPHDLRSLRGTGRTTAQIKDAPQGAYFVTEHGAHCDYVHQLCEVLGRTDLKLMRLTYLNVNTFRGRHITGLIVDHGIRLTAEHRACILHAQASIYPQEPISGPT